MLAAGANVHKFRMQHWLDGPNGRIYLNVTSRLDILDKSKLQYK